jgi:glycerophosphoryl diester phosphodiesterase
MNFAVVMFMLVIGAPLTTAKWKMKDLLETDDVPFAIAQRGYGLNLPVELGGDPNRVIENTIGAIAAGYDAGARIVEVDIQITADGKPVAFNEAYLDPANSATCLNSLTWDELHELRPEIPKLESVLEYALERSKIDSPEPTGLIKLELKTPVPLCDPDDTTEAAFVAAVLEDIKETKSKHIVIIESFSPKLISLVADQEPGIPLSLATTLIMFLPYAQVTAVTGLPVTPIDKNAGFGLQWAELSLYGRGVGYSSNQQVLDTAEQLGVTILKWELEWLEILDSSNGPGTAASLVAESQAKGFIVTGCTTPPTLTAANWTSLEGFGAEIICSFDIPLAVSLQADWS